ncbi:MAG: MFS transporter [Asticcacaulis sp.]|uniref:MFS transporter n=1 Tax=Asticcacaulis sp. TaxID=1872648 RepID=UPI0039E55D0E
MRQALFYGLLCSGTGASLPFLPSWLSHSGMSAKRIGWILAVPLIARALTGPLSGLWADRFVKYRTPLFWLAVTTTVAFALMGLVTGTETQRFWLFLILFSIGYTASASITPLLDAMTMQLGRSGRFSFAWVRASGSAAFIFANICLGYLLQLAGVNAVLAWMVASALCVCLGARFLLPAHSRLDPQLLARNDLPSLGRLATLLKNRSFVLLIISLGCLQAAHSYYYAFSTLIWEKAGLSPALCGYLWAFAVLSELLFLTFGGRLRHHLGPWRLLILGAAAGILRWGLMSVTVDLWLLWPLQVLHGLTFAAVYLAGLELVFLLVPPGFEGLGQAINSAYASGTMTGIGMAVSGLVFEVCGARGYSLMAVLCVIGLTIAMWLFLTKTDTSPPWPVSWLRRSS